MEEPNDKQPGSSEKLSSPEGDNLAMEVLAGDGGNQEIKEEQSLHCLQEELGQLIQLIVELKGSLIVLNRGIVAKQDTIEQLTERKQKLVGADKDKVQATIDDSLSLSSIAIRKTSVGVDVMDFARDAIEIFPEEIWELILANLTEPKDLRNCRTVCQLFNKILHPRKPNFLFSGIFPHLCPYLDDELILDCRRVCKGWIEGVDNFVENHPALLPCDKLTLNPRYGPPTANGLFLLEFSNKLGDLRQLNFLEKMRHHLKNPFVGRSVGIRIVEHYPEDFDDGEDVDPHHDDEENDWEDRDADDLEDDPFADDGDNVDEEDDPFADEDGADVEEHPVTAEDGGSEGMLGQKQLTDEAAGGVVDELGQKPFPDEDDDIDEWGTYDDTDDSDDDDDCIDFANADEDYGALSDFLPPNEAAGIPLEQQKQRFWQGLIDFLRVYGKHIWYLSFECRREASFVTREASAFRLLTKTIFTLTPNLRRIHIDGYLPNPSNPGMSRHLPVLPKLEALHIGRQARDRRDNLFEGSVIDTLIQASFQQLKQLHVDWYSCKAVFKSNLEWSNLTELYIHYGLRSTLKVNHVVSCEMPNLKKIGFLSHGFDCDFKRTMKIINGLSAKTNLQVLQIDGGVKRDTVMLSPNCLFAPPNLKTLEIDRSMWRGGGFSFLLRFPFLENLVIFYRKEKRTHLTHLLRVIRGRVMLETEIIDLETYMFEERVYESEIWKLLPRLKVFTADRDVHTREEYERIMSQKKKQEVEQE